MDCNPKPHTKIVIKIKHKLGFPISKRLFLHTLAVALKKQFIKHFRRKTSFGLKSEKGPIISAFISSVLQDALNEACIQCTSIDEVNIFFIFFYLFIMTDFVKSILIRTFYATLDKQQFCSCPSSRVAS